MIEHRFFVDTTFDRFADKIEHYTHHQMASQHNLGEGVIFHLSSAGRDRRTGRVIIEGFYTVHEEDLNVLRGTRPTPAIAFDIIPLSSERIEVAARCHNETIRTVFYKLIQEIERCWPKVREQREAKMAEMWTRLERVETALAEPDENAKTGKGKMDDKPWEQIPDHKWHREALRLWHQGYTAPEIGERLNRAGKTIRNSFTHLRKVYGEEIVPTDAQRRELRDRNAN